MTFNWKSVPIGKICRLVNGRAFKPSDWKTDGLRIVRIQNLNDPSKPFNYFAGEVETKFLIDTGDVLISWSGTPGTSFGCFIWERGTAILNQHIFKVYIDIEQVDKEFFVYAVNSKLDEMIQLAHGGVGLRHITKPKLESIELHLPELFEQKRVVSQIKDSFSRVKEITQLHQEQREELWSLKRSLVLGEQREDRNWIEIGKLVDWIKDTEPVNKTETYHFVGTKSFGKGLFHSATRTAQDFKYPSLRRLRHRDFIYPKLMAWEGAFGMVPQEFDGFVVSPEFVVFRTKDGIICPEVLDTYFRSPICLEDVRNACTGSNKRRRRINPQAFLKLKMPVPPHDVQEQLKKVYEFELKAAESWKDLPETLEKIRQSILKKAFAGEL